jgi:anti-sigma B factor antagonist
VDGVLVLDLEGRVVLGEESNTLRERVKGLLNEGSRKILLNLEQVSYIDSAGLGTLVSGFTSTRSVGGYLKMVNLTKKFRETLQITKLLTVFEVFDDEVTAIKSFR